MSNNDNPVEAPEELSQREIANGIQMQATASYRKIAKANEVALKGLYMTWAFNALNLNKYR